MSEDATLAILAGGAGSRMGRPKSRLTLDGRPILERLLDRLAWPGPTLLVTAPGRERPPGHERFDAEATDAVADEGPLRGLLTALDAAATSLLVVAPLDMPLLDAESLRWLLGHIETRAAVMVARDGRIEPMPVAFRVTPARAIARRLHAGGERALHALANEPDVSVEACPAHWPAAAWLNLNRPADVAAYEAYRGSSE